MRITARHDGVFGGFSPNFGRNTESIKVFPAWRRSGGNFFLFFFFFFKKVPLRIIP